MCLHQKANVQEGVCSELGAGTLHLFGDQPSSQRSRRTDCQCSLGQFATTGPLGSVHIVQHDAEHVPSSKGVQQDVQVGTPEDPAGFRACWHSTVELLHLIATPIWDSALC